MNQPEVARSNNRYEIRIDGGVVGVAQFVDDGNQRIFFHTEIDNAFQGRGLSTMLIDQALADTRAAGMRIVAVCPAVARYLQTHDAFADSTDRVTRDLLARLDELLQR